MIHILLTSTPDGAQITISNTNVTKSLPETPLFPSHSIGETDHVPNASCHHSIKWSRKLASAAKDITVTVAVAAVN
jgi:hypothetical protein